MVEDGNRQEKGEDDWADDDLVTPGGGIDRVSSAVEAPWIEPQSLEIPDQFAQDLDLPTIMAGVLYSRGFDSVEKARGFIDASMYTPTPPQVMPGMERAVNRIARAVHSGEKICVWGDFDVDGQTATALLVDYLKHSGADVSFYIPNRQLESHGIQVSSLAKVLDNGVQLVLTCDTGISEHEAVSYARDRGIDVIITDHHALPNVLPDAYAIVNPQLLPTEHSLRHLPGVGAAFKLIEALSELFNNPDVVDRQLDLAALGIVADVAVQQGDTRYLLQRGLERLRDTQRVGLRVVYQLAELSQAHISEEDIGYAIGPRLNALGRLSDANLGVELLLTKDRERAAVIANQLEGLNAQRQMLTSQIFEAAESQLKRNPELLDSETLVLSHPDWPAGIVGIVASRLAEAYRRPVILFVTPPGELARGSARSYGGVHITEAIKSQAHLLAGFGGHPMAAGLSLETDQIGVFWSGLSEAVKKQRETIREVSAIQLDGDLPLSQVNPGFMRNLEKLAPFGPGNPPILLCSRSMKIIRKQVFGRYQNHLRLRLQDEDKREFIVLWWQGARLPVPSGKFDLAYTVRNAVRRGQLEIQFQWVGYRLVRKEEAERKPARKIEVKDLRYEQHALRVIQDLFDERGDKILTWREAEHTKVVQGVNRTQLREAPTLVVWTTPPSPAIFQRVIESVKPQEIILVCQNPKDVQPHAIILRLLGVLKYLVREFGGASSLPALAGTVALPEVLVGAMLSWIDEIGIFKIGMMESGLVEVSEGDAGKAQFEIPKGIAVHLSEVLAYRRYVRTASQASVLP